MMALTGNVDPDSARCDVSPHRWVILIGCLSALCLLAGCDPKANITGPDHSKAEAQAAEQAASDFRIAMDFLDNFHEYETQSVSGRILYHLQKWAEAQDPDPDWIADPLFRRLPARFRRMQGESVLSRLQFQGFDIMMLREALWARDLARQVREAPLHDERLQQWLETRTPTLSADDRYDLETSLRICDWVVRNIQQTPILVGDGAPPAGAALLPGEAMLMGEGDWIVRSRIATLMGRQLGIPITMLAIEQDDAEPEPWCLAILVSRELYLFDMRWGLPLPASSGGGVVTLKSLLEEPSQLERYQLAGGPAYPIKPSDLKRVVAVIEATPEYLSQRMKLIESQLAGDELVTLTTTPSQLGAELRKCTGIGANVSLWTVPYDAYLYRQQLKTLSPFIVTMQEKLNLVGGPTPLAAARRQHFRGVYANTDDEEGAKHYYMACRIPDADLEHLLADAMFAKSIGGIKQLPKDPAERAAFLERTRQKMLVSKQYASYWLGLIAFEQGNYQVARDFFEKRVLQAASDSPWAQGARYNLARSLEQLGLTNEDAALLKRACNLYEQDRASPQADGNRWRSHQLRLSAADEVVE